jgi:hypothetical protein
LLSTVHEGRLSHPLDNPEKIYVLTLDLKLESIKNFINAICRDSYGFQYFKQELPPIREAKIK